MTLPPGVEVNGKKLRVSFTWEGVRHRVPLFLDPTPKNIQAAGKLRARVVAAIEHGVFTWEAFFPGRRETQTFRKLSEVWLTAKKAEVKKASWVKYEQTLEQFWLPSLGDLPISAVSHSSLLQAVGETDWSALSPKRYNDALIALRGVLQLAVDDGQLERNPAAKLRNRTPTPEVVEPFTMAEVELILSKLGATRPFYEILFFSGMRPGEAIALRWSDIVGNRISIQRARNLGVTSSTKTHTSRYHVAAPRVVAALGQLERMCDHVFYHPVMRRPFHEARPLREVWWSQALREAGLPARNLYVCRHTFASIALTGGANPVWLARQMGTSVQLIHKVYGRWIPSQGDRLEEERMAKLFG